MGVLPNEEFGRDALCLASTTIESHSVFIRDSFAIRDDRSKRGSCPLYRHPALCLERSGELPPWRAFSHPRWRLGRRAGAQIPPVTGVATIQTR